MVDLGSPRLPEPEEAVKPARGSNKRFEDKSVTGEECLLHHAALCSLSSCLMRLCSVFRALLTYKTLWMF